MIIVYVEFSMLWILCNRVLVVCFVGFGAFKRRTYAVSVFSSRCFFL